jgi:ribosomal protein L19E
MLLRKPEVCQEVEKKGREGRREGEGSREGARERRLPCMWGTVA